MCRGSRPEVFCGKGVLKYFVKLTGKHLCQSLFFAVLEACNFIKKQALAQVLSGAYCKTFKNPFSDKTSLMTVSKCAD